MNAERYKGHSTQQAVSQRIEKSAQHGLLLQVTSEIAIEEISEPGDGKDCQGKGELAIDDSNEKRCHHKDPQKTQRVRDIHLLLHK